jgi:hypothetical protein
MPKHEQFDILRRPTTTASHHQSEQHPENRTQNREEHPRDHAEPRSEDRPGVLEPHRGAEPVQRPSQTASTPTASTPTETLEVPAGQQAITPDIGPGDVYGFKALRTVTNAQREHVGDTELSATVTVHTDGTPVVSYCRSHDVPTWIAYADGDLVGDGSGPAHDWWTFRKCLPDDSTSLALQADLGEFTYAHVAEPRTVRMIAIAPPSAKLRACLAADTGMDYCPLPEPIAATDAEFGFRIYEHRAARWVLQLLKDPHGDHGARYVFEALSSIDGVAWLVDRGVVAAPDAARLAFELPASNSEYLVDVYRVDGPHMERCASQHADDLPNGEPLHPYLAALDKVCGVNLRLVVDGDTVTPDADYSRQGHFTDLGGHLSSGAAHQVEVEVVHGDPRNIRYAVVVRVRTQMP